MKDHQKANAIATERVQILSPLLTEGLDAAKARQLRDQICSQTGLSERTLRRYLAQYREEDTTVLNLKAKRTGNARTLFRFKSWSRPFS